MRIGTSILGLLLPSLLVFTGCSKKSFDADSNSIKKFKTGLARDDGKNGKEAILENSAFEEPVTEIKRDNSINEPVFKPTPVTPAGKGGTGGKTKPTGESIFPTRKICSDRGYKLHGFTLLDLQPSDVVVKLFPIEGNGQAPITFNVDSDFIADIVNTGDFGINFSDVADGTYNILLCNKGSACEETDFLREYGELIDFQRDLFSDYESEYFREEKRGVFKFTKDFDRKNHKTVRDEIIFENEGVFGGAPRITVENGLVRYPEVSYINKNEGIRVIRSSINAVEFETVMAPQVVLLYDTNKKDSNNLLGGEYGDYENDYEECDGTVSPLVIDFANKGVELSAPLDGVEFDIDADGKKDQISWPLGGETSFLTLDVNANGNIDNGTELFGNFSIGPDQLTSSNGFLALAKYDDNKDSKINASDEVYSKLRLWTDVNFDGVAAPDELKSLEDLKVGTIDLLYTSGFEMDVYGNETRERSSVILEDGTLRMVFDIWFRKIRQ
ncbi:MAG: hypothetical protein AB7T49_12185 [Oligoflexales bacterium]